MSELQVIETQGGGYGPPPGGYGPPPGGAPPGGGGYGPPPGGGGYGPPPGGGGYGPPPGGGGYGPPPGGAPPGGPAYGGPPPGWVPPPGGPGGPGSPGADIKKQATTWLIVSAVSFFFCGGNCLALIGAILCFLAMQAVDQGQLADAESKVKLGRTLTIVGFALFAVMAIVGIIYYFVVIAAAVATS
jgi:hypothetical protein